jgi:hypothetical protein
VLLAQLGRVAVLDGQQLFECVVVHEVEYAVGRDVPAPRHPEIPEDHVVGPGIVEDPLGTEQAGRLAAQLAVAGCRPERVPQHPSEVGHRHMLLDNVDVVEILCEEPADESDPDAGRFLRGQVPLRFGEHHEALQGLGDLSERYVTLLGGGGQESRVLVAQPRAYHAGDLVGAQLLLRDLEYLVDEVLQSLVVDPRYRPVVGILVVLDHPVGALCQQVGHHLDDALHAPLEQIVHHLATYALDQYRVGFPQQVYDDLPFGLRRPGLRSCSVRRRVSESHISSTVRNRL